MSKLFGVFTGVVAAVLIACFSCPAAAGPLEVKIVNSWNYNYATQHGSHGFFGAYNTDNRPLAGNTDYAPLNGWLGSTMVSGSNAALSALNTVIEPTLKINEALELKATYAVPYRTNDSPGPSTPMSTGNWSLLRARANTPMGSVYYGKFFFGSRDSLQYDRSRRTEEYLMLLVSGAGPYCQPPPKKKSRKNEQGIGAYDDDDLCPLKKKPKRPTIDDYVAVWSGWNQWIPRSKLLVGFYPWRRGRTHFQRADRTETNYWNVEDLNAVRALNLMEYVEWDASSWRTSVLGIWTKYREGPESQETEALREDFPPTDTGLFEGSLSFQYDSGRLYLDSELDWYFQTIRYQRSLSGDFNGSPDNTDGSGSLFAPDFIESWRFKTEFRMVFGPLAVWLLYTHMSGPDRRHGVLIDRQPYVRECELAASSLSGRYSNILANSFDGGVDGPGFGDVPDASCFGVRLDYALAANLLVYSSFFYANRISHGYGWGYIRPTIQDDIDEATAKGITPSPTYGSVSYGIRGTYTFPAPAIPDNNLGWEVDAGITWKLLNSWTFSLSVGYWQPGRWFNYACIDKSVENWDIPSSANNFGINPNRTIDPVSSVSVGMTAEF